MLLMSLMNTRILLIVTLILFIGLILNTFCNNYKLLIKFVKFNPVIINNNNIDNINWQSTLHTELFNHYISEPDSIKPVQSLLKIKILGILYSTTNKNSQVLINNSQKTQIIYKVGDELMPAINIAAIHSTSIVINNHGRLNTIKLPKEII